MKQFRFLDWRIYADAQSLFMEVLRTVDDLPRQYRYDLGSQVIRSAFSVILNMAEGSGKPGDPELNRYLDISLGSLYETKAALDTFAKGGLCEGATDDRLDKKIQDLASQIGGFKKKLKPKKP